MYEPKKKKLSFLRILFKKVPEDEQEEVERLRGKILALSRLRHVMSGLGEDRRQSIQTAVPIASGAPAPKGATPGQLAKFEAALQMDFMREYLKPGAKLGDGEKREIVFVLCLNGFF